MARVEAERQRWADERKAKAAMAPQMDVGDVELWIEQQLDRGWVFDERGRSHVPGVKPWRDAPVGWTAAHWDIVQRILAD
jgi:hypothetical protein